MVVALAAVVGRDYAGVHHIYWMAVVMGSDETVGNEIIKKADDIFKEKSDELGIPVSAASGVAVRSANEDIRDAKKRVDEAMYACKQRYYQQTDNDRRNRD